jgi:hypothetical protein
MHFDCEWNRVPFGIGDGVRTKTRIGKQHDGKYEYEHETDRKKEREVWKVDKCVFIPQVK